MCLRNICGGAVNPQLPLTELSLKDIQSIFPIPFIKQLKRIYLCGNYGDPMIAKDTLKVFQFFRETNPKLSLSMFTNGSGQTTRWWQQLAKLIDVVHFSIDGLEHTNAIYRRGTNFQKIIKNAKAYLEAGGKAIWDFIVFRHNEHQVEAAQKLSQDMGFFQFVIKKTGRFYSNQQSNVKTAQVVLNHKQEIEYYLETPTNKKYQNLSLQKERILSNKYGNLHNYLNQTPIECRVQREKSIYISAEALVFPCCWTANQLYPWYFKKNSSQIGKWVQTLPQKKQSLSAKHQTIQKIIEDDFFQHMVPNSWKGTDINKDKLRVCAKTCGKDFIPFEDQFK